MRVLHAEMQHDEALAREAHEDGNAQRSTRIGNREQGLDSFDVPDADGQTPLLFVDRGYPIGLDGFLDPEAHPMLVDVEEQELFQRRALIDR